MTERYRVSKILQAEAFLVDIPVETVRTDAVQAFLKQETVFVRVTEADGYVGLGYTYTIGTGGTAVLAMLRDYLLPRLVGQDATQVEGVWMDLFAATRATTTGAITSLALAAVDTALWDIRCLRSGLPLWREAGGFRDRVPLYDTEGGWLHLTTDELVRGAVQSRDAGWPGVKVKVGKPHVAQDLERLVAVRDAVGPTMHLMVDANQSMTLAEARRRAAAYETVDVFWFEEPMPADDVAGHAQLAMSTSVPVAVGESLYSLQQFGQYLRSGAASIVQVDVARIGGVTPWLKVAHAAEAFNVKVCPHFLMELHVSLTAAVPNGLYVEHIPQLRSVTRSGFRIEDGHALAPVAPGLGLDWDQDSLDDGRTA
jgi:L-alanine-DL-glutamate epimerase-like enolase superfamily enzyme